MEETKEERRARKERERAERKKNETEEERHERKERERAERKARETAAAIEAAAHEDLAPAPNKKDENSSSNRKRATTTSTNVAEGASTSAGPQSIDTTTHHKRRADETEEERRARKAKERAERKAREAAAAAGEPTNDTADNKQRKDGDSTATREKKKEGESDVSAVTKPRERKPTNETEEERRARKAKERAERKAREAAAAQDAAKSERDSSANAPAAEEAKEHKHHHHHHSSSPSPSSASRQTTKKKEEEDGEKKKKKPTNESDARAALREAIAAENEAALSRQPSAAAAAGRNNTGRLTSKLAGDVESTQVSANGTVKSAGGSRPVSRPGLSQVRQASTLSINTTTTVTSVEELRRQAYRSQFVHDCARATALRRLVDLDEVTVGLVDFAPQSAYERYLQQLSAAEAHRTTNTSTGDNEQVSIAIPSQVAVQCPDETMRSDMAVQAIRTRWRSHGLQVPDDLGLYPEGLQDATLTLLRRQRRNADGAEDSEEDKDNTVGKEEEEGDNANKGEDKTATTATTSNTITTLSRFLDRVMPVMEAILDESDALQLASQNNTSDALKQEEGTKAQQTTAFSSLAVSLRCEGLTHYNNNSTSGTLYVRPVRALSYHAASPHLLLALYGPFTTTTTTTTTTDKANGSDMIRASQYASLVLIWDTRSLRATTTNRSSSNRKSPTPSSTTMPRHVLASDDVLTCVTSSASRPHLIYAGTASGAVVVWDLRESDRLHESGAITKSNSKGVGMVPIPHLPSYSSSWLAVDEMGSTNSPHTVNNRLSGHTSDSEEDEDEYQSNNDDEEEGGGYYGGLRTTTTTKMVAPIRKVVVLGHNSVTRAALRDLRTTTTTTTNNNIDDSSAMVNDGSNVGGAGGQEEAEQLVSLDASGQLRFWRVQEQPSLRHIVAESDYAMRPFAVVRLHMLSQRYILPNFSTGMDFMSSDGMNMLLSGGMNAAQRIRNADNNTNNEDDDAYHADDDIDYDDDEDDIFAHRAITQKMNRHGRHKATRSSPGSYFHSNNNDSEDEGRNHGTRKEVHQQRWLRLVGGTEAYDVDCLPTDPTHLLVCLPDAVHHVSQFSRYAAPALYKPGTCIDVTALSSGLPLAIPSSTTPFPPTEPKNTNSSAGGHGMTHAGVAAWLPTPRCLTSNAQDSRIWLVGYEDGTVRMYVASESNPVLTVMVSEAPIVQVLPYAVANTTTTSSTSNSVGNEKERAAREEGYLVNTSMSSHTGLMADSNTASSPALTIGTTINSTRWLSWALDEAGTVYLLDHAHMNRTAPRLVEPLQAQRESCGKCLCLATLPAMRGAVSESIISTTRAGNEKNNSTTNNATSMLALGYERGVVELHIVDHTAWLSNAAERDEQWL